MPPLLPWKKSKIARASQRFVSDLRSSSKQGGSSSLVVQTGFPTSLIDLISKNRDRLKKPSSKKKKSKKNHEHEQSFENFPPPPLPPPSSGSSAWSEIDDPNNQGSNVDEEETNPNPCLDGDYKKTQVEIVEKEEELDQKLEISSSSCLNRKGVFSSVLKVFFVLVLAFGTKKLAIAMTVLAFSLLFVESTGVNLFRFLKPCADAKERLNSADESLVGSVQSKNEQEQDEDENVDEGEDEVINEQEETKKLIEKSYLIEQENATTTMVVSANVNSVEANVAKRIADEIQNIEPSYSSLYCGCRWGFTDRSSKTRSVSNKVKDLIENDIRNSKKMNGSARFNAKMLKKFVPLRFKKKRRKQVGNMDLSFSGVSASNDGQTGSLEGDGDEQECNEQEGGQEQEVDYSDEKDEDGKTEEQSLDYVSQIETLSDVGESDGKIVGGRRSVKHLIPMVVVVLAGLMGGRVIALAVTLVCCLLMKFMRNRMEGAYR